MIVDDKNILAGFLAAAATAVGDTLNAAQVDAETMAFAIVLWPIEEPQHCSSVCGSGRPLRAKDVSAALTAASNKVALGEPHLVTNHTAGKAH